MLGLILAVYGSNPATYNLSHFLSPKTGVSARQGAIGAEAFMDESIRIWPRGV
jgi:hypothetical protein